MGAGFHGKFNNTKGAKEAANARQSLPQNNAQLKHIFSGKDGHLTDTPQNIRCFPFIAQNAEILQTRRRIQLSGLLAQLA